MTNVKTLIEMLEFRATETPDKTAFTFIDQPCTYDEMWQQVNRFGAYLREQGVNSGDRVVMTLPNSTEFFSAFYGIQRVGAIPVPLFPGFGPDHVLSIMKLCGAGTIVVPSSTPQKQLEFFKTLSGKHNLSVVTVSDSASHPTNAEFPHIEPDDVAFIQYTSGSTGNPKGVQISHNNLITNIRQMIAAMKITENEIFVSWLPVYHDMGLILKTITPFYLAADIFLLPSSLKNVVAWLEAIQKHKATFTAAPDFAYRLCLRHIQNPEDYDLSSLRVALNAAEPVRHQTILDFEEKFGLKNVMVAAYGLAEATVGASMWPPNTKPKVDQHGHVSIGRPFPDIEITILQNGQAVGPGVIGEIAVKSTAIPRGYYNNPEATRNLHWKPNTILSGDLGYLDEEGDLFIVGRKKNSIIHAGHTIYPQEIEEVVDSLSSVRYSIAVGIDKGRIEGEQVYVFAEIRNGETASENALQDMVVEIVDKFHHQLGFRPGRVYLVKPKTIPMTYNGKFQHSRLKDMYLDGTLFEEGRILYPTY
ncbi:MAG: fatty acyl-AMP ligase [Ketobacter sp.]|nr:fatty acyl-AMP ligase [Ketobacter sp.]